MKKRLLSAALALAMVLTLLPMSVFAATYNGPNPTPASSATGVTPDANNPVGKSFTQQTNDSFENGVTKRAGKWYWSAPAVSDVITVYEADTGFLVGNAWYPSEAEYIRKNPSATTFPSSFTLLSPLDLSSITLKKPTSLNVDVNGCALTLPDLDTCGTDDQSPMTSITITDKLHPNRSGSVSGLTSNRTLYSPKRTSGVTLTATNVDVNVINLAGRGNNVTLNNCASTGITLNGQSIDSAGKTSYTGQTLKTNDKTHVSGSITVTGDSSTVNLQDTVGGAAVSLESNGGSLTVGGYSTIGAVTVKNNQKPLAATDGNIPTVTVNGGTVAGIDTTDSVTKASSSITVNRTNNDINISGEIKTTKGTVGVTNANTKAITVGAGSLTISGDKMTIGGDVTLGATDATTLSISATNSTFAGVKAAAGKGNNLTISQWPTGRNNYYGTLDLQNYKGKGVKGGTFSGTTATSLGKFANIDWVDNANLQFIVSIKTNAPAADAVALYGRDELTEAISSIAATTPANPRTDDIILLGQNEDSTAYIQLNFGGNPWAYLKYNSTTGIKLPTRINNTGIAKWIVKNGLSGTDTGSSFTSGVTENVPFVATGVVLDSTNTSAEVTKITGVSGTSNGTVDNSDVRVTLSNNTINVSGAIVAAAGGIASINVNLVTDVVGTNGQVVQIPNVIIDYDVNTKKVSFNSIQPSLAAYGIIVQDGALVLNRGTGAKYTVTANLAVSASELNLAPSAGLSVTVGGKLSGWSNEAKQKMLIDPIQTNGTFTYTGNKAMLEAINAAQATITNNNSVSGWINNAKETIWRNGFTSPDGSTLTIPKHSGNFKDAMTGTAAAQQAYKDINDVFQAAYIVPYLVVNVTDYNAQSGTLTATLTPYYRVDVSTSGSYNAQKAYTVQAGRTLGALTGDMSSPIKVKLGLTSTAFNNAYAHQDDTYVYQDSAGGQEYSFYHAGKTGLGTIEINNTDGLISITSNVAARGTTYPSTPNYKYTSLQAAVDDTVPGVTQPNTTTGAQVTETMDTITVDGNYKGSCDFTMTGYARKIKVVALGDLPIKCTSQNVDVQNPSGYTYIFQLKRDTAPTGGNITIASATGGTASVSANPAAAGQTVTITLNPATGYTSSGVSVRTSSGQTVSVSGSGNRYTFTMPSGAVTVTPSFTRQQAVNPTVSVSNSGTGTAVTSAGTSQVQPGTTVTVTTSPAANQRTMGLNVTGATAIRTGANTFTFVVPSGYTNVVVTPRFDRDNGTMFDDVWSYDYFSDAVAWASTRGITNGDGSIYHFGTGKSCTRQDMVTFLWRNAGSPVVSGVRNPFWDVQPSAYYYNAVMWAVSKGITNGVTATQFGVDQPVSRAQAVTFLYRAAGSPTASTNSGFYDVSSREYYAKAVSWAVAKGITNGDGSSVKFSPNSACLREQIVAFMYRDTNNIRA